MVLSSTPQSPPLRDLVLIGGGHAHVQVLRRFAMQPIPWLRLTLIARETATPYSGMLPGFIAGHYSADELHIDLPGLCAKSGARLIADEAIAVDADAQSVRLESGPPIRYDVLSINCGGAPVAPPGAVPVKPIGRFLPAWTRVSQSLSPGDRVAIVGAGAGGVELALAVARALPASNAVSLLTRGRDVVPELPRAARQHLASALAESRVDLATGFDAESFDSSRCLLRAADGRELSCQAAFWVTDVAPPPLLVASNLATASTLAGGEGGFLQVNDRLQSVSHPNVFGAGDCVALSSASKPNGLPKAGVYAVRAGPVLTDNLIAAAKGSRLRRYRPQKNFLTLIGCGNGRAVASRGRFAVEGTWAWRLKDWIDRRFMFKFNGLPAMSIRKPEVPEKLAADAPDAMRCAGCGGKVGADPLARVLHRLDLHDTSDRLLLRRDDAAEVRWLADRALLSADAFRAMLDDPYRFGRIAAHHALSDIFAMAGQPVAALALASVPAMADALVEDDLYRLLRGALDVLQAHGCELAGGHSMEAPDLSLGFAVVAEPGERVLAKAGMQPGDRLVLSKPLGSGVLLAAHMRGELPAKHFDALLNTLDTSNAAAARALAPIATAMTDVTGFGLLGHLVEMTDASGVGATVERSVVPLLPGVEAAFERGVQSSLQLANERVLGRFTRNHAQEMRSLVDPQTAGGLLASVPPHAIDELLRVAPDLAVIGEVSEAELSIR